MDTSKDSENESGHPLRRSARRSSIKALSYEPTPRGPLKRSKRGLKRQAPAAAVNGSREEENGSDDEELPKKKNRLDRGDTLDDTLGDILDDTVGSNADETEMDFQESSDDTENKQDQAPQIGQDFSHDVHQPKISQGAAGDVTIAPRVHLGERCQSKHAVNENSDWITSKTVKPSTKEPAAPIKSAVQTRSPVKTHDVPTHKITSMAEYKSRMEAKARSAGIHIVNQRSQVKYPAVNKYTTRQRLNNIPSQKETSQHKNQVGKKKTAVTKSDSKFSCRGFMCSLWFLVLLVLLSSVALVAYKKIPILQRTLDKGRYLYRAAKPEIFTDHLSVLESQFPSQRPELWRMSKIHLEKHLRTAQPTEPVSLILTAGVKAERTLHCLAKGLASSFSAVLNASVLHIDGASKAGQDSDDVKLDIDQQLQEAFEGDKPVAVIHRLEELPPGSTLIFYRYCDHENAAFKQVFLLFTVLLPQGEVSSEESLQDVEEAVHDYVQKRLVGSTNQTAFNNMDTNKFGGLWSRISHLILPVVFEQKIEQEGC